MATSPGAEKHVRDAITKSGVKDSFAMPIIEALISAGKKLRMQRIPHDEIVSQLSHDLEQKMNSHTLLNPLLLLDGTHFISMMTNTDC